MDFTPDTIREIVALGQGAIEPMDHPAGGKVVVVPAGYETRHLQPIDRPLTHTKQTVNFSDAASFILYVNDFKDDYSRTFANIDTGKITTVIDYHGSGGPDYCDHKAIYALPFSEEWKRWTGIDGRAIDQRAFAEFLQENAIDIVEPVGAELLEIAMRMQTTRKTELKSAVNLSNGTTQFVFQEEDDTKAGKQTLSNSAEDQDRHPGLSRRRAVRDRGVLPLPDRRRRAEVHRQDSPPRTDLAGRFQAQGRRSRQGHGNDRVVRVDLMAANGAKGPEGRPTTVRIAAQEAGIIGWPGDACFTSERRAEAYMHGVARALDAAFDRQEARRYASEAKVRAASRARA